ncbi:MAG: FAD-dependent oxidoreductase [Deltaproteobacteria bacterium]|nr:FAD-dependent oxidoreductase [Deltaproteobacteria bacterium]
MAKHLVFAGGGHAHLTALRNIGDFRQRGYRVTVITPSPYQYYSGMGPGMLSGLYGPEEIRFDIQKMGEKGDGTCVQERKSERVFTVKPVANLVHARERILELIKQGIPRLLVVGGGPSALEISVNAWKLVQDHGGKAHITVMAGTRFLSRFPQKVRSLALKSLTKRAIDVREDVHVTGIQGEVAILEDGRSQPFDVAFLGTGIKPSGLFQDSGLPVGEDGGLLVNTYLQSVGYSEIFGGGDCICFQQSPLDKVGVYAVRQNPILYHNLLAALEGGALQRFDPGGAYMLLFNMGDGRAIYHKNGRIFHGRIPFILKDWIDRKFMRKFQR